MRGFPLVLGRSEKGDRFTGHRILSMMMHGVIEQSLMLPRVSVGLARNLKPELCRYCAPKALSLDTVQRGGISGPFTPACLARAWFVNPPIDVRLKHSALGEYPEGETRP